MNHYPCSEGERLLARLPIADLPVPIVQVESFLSELRLDPSPPSPRLKRLKEKYESILSLLESEFVGAMVSGDWAGFDELVEGFRSDNNRQKVESI